MYCHYVGMASLEDKRTQGLIVSGVGAAGVFGPIARTLSSPLSPDIEAGVVAAGP